jgi:hypothetical protein
MFRWKFLIIFILFSLLLVPAVHFANSLSSAHQWQVESIDTMKYSRDLARQELSNPAFDKEIESEMQSISVTGANYVAIDTPYDKEFLPILTRWVNLARKYHLHVWFRGNFSGWEQWFDYPKMTRTAHTEAIKQFILQNPNLFENKDIFTSCPECENAAIVNFSDAKQLADYRSFLINEYITTKASFNVIGKDVIANYYSMNGDVARAVMDRKTTAALDGVVTVDHYVATPEKLASDLRGFADRSGGKVVLGEFGAPIPDIHGNLTEDQQKQWVSEALQKVSELPEVVGVNYWDAKGGSTALWHDDGSEKPVVSTISQYYSGKAIQGTVIDTHGNSVAGASVILGDSSTKTDSEGKFYFPYSNPGGVLHVSGGHFADVYMPFSSGSAPITVVLGKKNQGIISWFFSIFHGIFHI